MNNDIKQQIADYKPSRTAVESLQSKRLVIFAGITSAGKNTIMNELIKTGEYYDLVTATTRPPRVNDGVMEVEGVDYHFLSTEEALEHINNGDYLEVAAVHERINGLLASELVRAGSEHQTPVIDVDVQGVDTFKNLSDNVIAVFVVPPSYQEWVRRMKKRYPTEQEFNEAWPVRRRSAIMELKMALSKPYYHFIVNENIPEAVQSALAISTKPLDEFNQIDRSYHVWAQRILHELEADSDSPA